MKKFVIILLLLKLSSAIRLRYHDDDWINFVKSFGYKCEAHKIVTQDGYILTIHRILPKYPSKYSPVLLQHGLFHTSGTFVGSGNNSLAFYLADNGIDVWLGNGRGNRYSMGHTKMSSENPEFWDHSFHEIGYYDLASMIDYILKSTNSTRVSLIGHSEGGSDIAVLLSTRPKYNQKIKQVHLLAPGVFMQHFPNQVAKSLLMNLQPTFDSLITQNSYDQILNNNIIQFLINMVHQLYKSGNLCSNSNFSPLCTSIAELLCSSKMIDSNLIDWSYVLKTHPNLVITNSFSMKKLIHFTQLIQSGKFRRFDNGMKNMQLYRNFQPPDYNLKLITSPTYIYSGGRDALISPVDLVNLKKVLPNVKSFKYLPKYSHCDIIFGFKAKEDIYHDILRAIRK